MNTILKSWTAQLTGMTSSLVIFCGAVGVVAILVVVVKGLIIDEDRNIPKVIIRVVFIVFLMLLAAGADTLIKSVM